MNAKRSQEELFILWGMLDIEFFNHPPASHAKVAEQVVEWILWRERLRNNQEQTNESRQKCDEKTMAKLKAMDTNDPALLLVEKVFKRLINNRGSDAMLLLQTAIQNKSNAITKRQQKIAKLPRLKSRHPLSVMVDSIVQQEPNINVNLLFFRLRNLMKNNPMAPCSFDFAKEIFIPIHEGFDLVPKANLSDYLFRAKRRLRRVNQLE